MKNKIFSYALLTTVTVFGGYSSQALSALPACMSESSDSDGDGFGWENSASCKVTSATPIDNTPTVSNPSNGLAICQSSSSDSDNDGFGWENSASCRVATDSTPDSTPTNTTGNPTCVSSASDTDGDGFGWENSRSCVVGSSTGSVSPETPTPPTSSTTPDCALVDSDPDGDGYGWENNQSCIAIISDDDGGTTTTTEFKAVSPAGVLTTGTPTFQWNALADADMYTLAISDSLGNGYSYQIDPMRAGCQTGTGTCTANPTLSYNDSPLSWRVKTTVNGSDGPESNRLSITTPKNTAIQLVTAGECEAWPSVAYDKYVVLNNTWNSRSMNRDDWVQKIYVNEDNFGNIRPSWNYNWLGQYDGDEIEVKSYPEVLYGPKLGTHVSAPKSVTGLPEMVSALPEFKVDYAYTETGNAERNVALESFFHDSSTIAGPCDVIDNRAYEMMIWVENPSIRTPGQLALTGVMIDNRLWNVYIKPTSNKHYIAFTAQNSQSTGTINWNRFVEWTQTWTAENAEELSINVLLPEYYMGAIEIGTETWWGEGTFTLDKFDVTFR